MSISSVFRFQADPRIVVVSDIRDFALLKSEPGVLGVTMRNPVPIPEDAQEIAAVMKATMPPKDEDRMFLNQSELESASMPVCIRETGHLIFKAFSYSGKYMGPFVTVRQNLQYPLLPHRHHMVGMADIFGSTTVGLLGEREHELYGRYDFPRRHITLFRDIWHEAGAVQPGVPRLNIILG